MSIDTEIANAAATYIGTEATMLALTDDTHVARTIRRVWGQQRRATIREGNWNFALRRKGLAAEAGVAAGDIYPWAYRFPLPAGCLRLTEVLSTLARECYQLEGGAILANVSGPLYVRYAVDVPECSEWDELFAEAFARRIAFACGERIAGSAFSKTAAWDAYENALSVSKRADVREEPPLEQEESAWIEARLAYDTSGRPGPLRGY